MHLDTPAVLALFLPAKLWYTLKIKLNFLSERRGGISAVHRPPFDADWEETMSVTSPYFEVYPVLRHDCDLYGRIRPSAVLRYTQQVATVHAEKMGLGDDYYAQNHVAFLLAKQALEFTRVPMADELLTYITYPEGCKRATYKRVTVITDAQGREVACLDSRWVLVDLDTRRILRRPPEGMNARWLEQVDRTLDLTIPKAAALQSAGTRRAEYSLCDVNGHMNNTVYVDLACDLLEPEALAEAPLRRVVVSYHREIPYLASAELLYGPAENGLYVTGVRDGLTAFEAYCGF